MNLIKPITHPLGITIIYALLGFVWIFYSDYLVSEVLLVDPDALREVQSFKGTIFVILSAGLIYALTKTLNVSLKEKIIENRSDKERLNDAQQIGKIGDWSYDVETGAMHWSDEVYRIYGLDPQLPPPSREEVRKFYPEYDVNKLNQAVETAINEGLSYDLDTKIVVNGQEKIIRNLGIPVRKNRKTIQLKGIVQDITSRKRAEIERKELAERLNTIANNLPGAVFQYVLNPDGTDALQYLSHGAKQLWGIAPEEGMKNNELIWNQIHEEDLPSVFKSIQKSAETMGLWQTSWRSNHPTKGLCWHEGTGQPVQLKDGTICWNSIILDVTDRKKAQIAVREGKNLLEKTINSIKEVVFLINPADRSIVMANAATKDIFGYDPGELIGKNTEILHVSSEQYQAFSEIGEPVLKQKGVFRAEFQMKHKNGSLIETENTVSLISESEGLQAGAVSVVRDVTQAKEAERKIKEREEYLSVLMSNASDAILACDDKGNIKFYNETLEKWVEKVDTSIPIEKWPEKYKWFDLNTKQPLKKENISLICALTKGKVRNHQFMIQRNSERRYIEANGAALYAYDKRKIGAMVLMRDITDRMNRDIEISNAILEAIDDERIDIASEIHDNLTQTLSIVSQNIKNLILADESLGENIKLRKAQQFLQSAIDESRDLSHRIMPKSIEDFGLVTAIEELIENMEKIHSIDFKFTYTKDFRLKKDIEINVFRILQEAITNIVKHSKASLVKIALEQTDDTLVVNLADNGVGFSTKSKGKGIGMSTMKNRALKINAGFNIKSSDTGTAIELKVPLT